MIAGSTIFFALFGKRRASRRAMKDSLTLATIFARVGLSGRLTGIFIRSGVEIIDAVVFENLGTP